MLVSCGIEETLFYSTSDAHAAFTLNDHKDVRYVVHELWYNPAVRIDFRERYFTEVVTCNSSSFI